jgi:hypothetical protein
VSKNAKTNLPHDPWNIGSPIFLTTLNGNIAKPPYHLARDLPVNFVLYFQHGG